MDNDSQKTALNVSSLKDRGWTDAGIRHFLTEPDFTKTNPRYRSVAPMRFYFLERVEKVEESSEYQAWAERSVIRKASTLKAAEAKRVAMIEWAQSIPIDILVIPEATLREYAVEHYNNLWADRDSAKRANLDSSDDFIKRLKVNYLRHCRTDYESLLQQTFGKVGTDAAYEIIKERVLETIGELYPELCVECRNQLDRLDQQQTMKSSAFY